jgi:hypothetical protein
VILRRKLAGMLHRFPRVGAEIAILADLGVADVALAADPRSRLAACASVR